MMWVMKDEPPSKVIAAGGRVQRTEPAYGNIYDHFNATIEWPTKQRCYFACRQWNNADNDVSDWAFGTQGQADIYKHRISGKNEWKGKEGKNMYDLEHEAFFKSIRDDAAKNDGDYMAKSTLVAMMVRMSAYTGKTVYWDKAAAEADRAPAGAPIVLESTEDLSPPKYEFGPLPVAPVAVPGVTKFA
jgi:predicted dehydrogenase